MNGPLTIPEATATAFALQFEHTMSEAFLNRNIDLGLCDEVKCTFRHQVEEYVGRALLRPDAGTRLELDVHSGDNPTELALVLALDGDHDPDAIRKMANWAYPTADQVAADKKARMEAYQKACEAQRAKDEERRQLRLTVGKAMADELAGLLGGALPSLLDNNMEARRVYHDMLNELRSGGFDDED